MNYKLQPTYLLNQNSSKTGNITYYKNRFLKNMYYFVPNEILQVQKYIYFCFVFKVTLTRFNNFI